MTAIRRLGRFEYSLSPRGGALDLWASIGPARREDTGAVVGVAVAAGSRVLVVLDTDRAR